MADFRVIRSVLRPKSPAEKHHYANAGVSAPPVPEKLVGLQEAFGAVKRPTHAHDLIYYGGKTMPDLVYSNFFLGGAAAWSRDDVENINWSLSQAMQDSRLNNVIRQYFNNRAITSTFKRSLVMHGERPSVVSQSSVEQLLRALHREKKIALADLNKTVFNILLPRGTVLNDHVKKRGRIVRPQYLAQQTAPPTEKEKHDSSIHGLGGYHGSVHLAETAVIYYAVGVYSEVLSDGTENGIVVFKESWKNVVATFYHELNEARTDPDIDDANRGGTAANHLLGWVSKQGEECGDYPMQRAGNNLKSIIQEVDLANGRGKVPVQFEYSNAIGKAEGPIATPH